MEEINTKERIIRSAMECFSRNGYDGTSVERICESARISKGSFFYYFPTKQSLFLEILSRWLEDVDRNMGEVVKADEDIRIKLLNLSMSLIDILTTGEKEISLTFEFLNRALHDEETFKRIISMFESYRNYFSSLLEEDIKKGRIINIDPKIVSYTIVSFAVGLLVQRLFSVDDTDWVTIAREGLEIIIKGLIDNSVI